MAGWGSFCVVCFEGEESVRDIFTSHLNLVFTLNFGFYNDSTDPDRLNDASNVFGLLCFELIATHAGITWSVIVIIQNYC